MNHKHGLFISLGKFLMAASVMLGGSQLGSAATITLSTAANTSGNAGGSFSFINGLNNANIAAVPDLLTVGTFQFSAVAGNTNVVDMTVTPKVGANTTTLKFVGTLMPVGSGYLLNFNTANTAGSFTINNASSGNVNYTALLFNGYDFALQSLFQLNSGTSVAKITNVMGFVQAAPAVAPEPASVGLVGLSFVGAALVMRRKRANVR